MRYGTLFARPHHHLVAVESENAGYFAITFAFPAGFIRRRNLPARKTISGTARTKQKPSDAKCGDSIPDGQYHSQEPGFEQPSSGIEDDDIGGVIDG
jgi:hypothetical protein